MSSESYLLVKGISGLGNRLLSLLTATLYARLSGRQLAIDWADAAYSDDGTNVFPRLFLHADWQPGMEIPESASVAPPIWRGRLHDTAYSIWHQNRHLLGRRAETWRSFSIGLERLDHREEIVVMWSSIEEIDRLRRHFPRGAPELRGISARRILCDLYRSKIGLLPEIQQTVDDYRQRHFDQPVVGVHLRYTDKMVDLGAATRKLDRLLDGRPDLEIFLATDNPSIEQRIRQRYRRVSTTEKVFPEEGAMHRQFHHPGRLDHAREAVLDLYLLSGCDFLIGDMSSAFAFVAMLIGDFPASHIVNIQRARWLPRKVRRWLWLMTRRLVRPTDLR